MDSTVLPPSTGNFSKGPRDETPESGKPVKCDLCNVWCQGIISYQTHLQGRQHFANLKGGSDETTNGDGKAKKNKKRPSGVAFEEVRCEVCDISCLGKEQYESHIQGIRHAKKLKIANNEEDVDLSKMDFIKDLGNKRFECTICHVEMTGKPVILSHISGVKHQRKADPNTPKTAAPTVKKNLKTTPAGEPLECKICKLPVNSLIQLEEHKTSLKHKHREEAYNKWAAQEANLGKDYDAWDPSG